MLAVMFTRHHGDQENKLNLFSTPFKSTKQFYGVLKRLLEDPQRDMNELILAVT